MSLYELIASVSEERQTDSQKMNGVAVGIVEDIRDPEKLGRVRVRFPWLAEKKEDTVSIEEDDAPAHSYWARTALLMAGAKRGTFFIPEVNDEVLVGFEHGDLDRPYVLGMLWNKEDMPPEEMDSDGANHIRAIYSRASQATGASHRIVFDDSDDTPSIRIEDNTSENYVLIDSIENAMTIKVAGDLTIEAGGKVTIKAGADISIETQANLSAKAQRNASLQSGGPMEVKSDAKVAIDGSISSELTAKTVTVKGAAMTEVKGGLVKIN